MKIRFNIKRIFIIVAFATILFASSVYATEINNISDLQGVFNGATIVENKIILDDDYDLGNNAVMINSGTYEIDLNGHNIISSKASAIEVWNGDLTISDSGSSLGLISINNSEDFASPIYIEDGSLTINNGKVGDFASASDCGLYIEGGTVIINNGEFAGLIHGLYMESGMLTINNGIIKSTTDISSNDAIGIYGGTSIINDGTFTSSTLLSDGWGISADNYFGNTSITINGGTFTGKLIGADFYKETDNEFSIIINGGTFTGELYGMYFYKEIENKFSIIINGGTFIGKFVGLALNNNVLSNIKISAGIFKSNSTTASERLGGIGVEYNTSVPDINLIIKEGSSMYPSSTSLSSYTFENNEIDFLRTDDEVRIGVLKTITIQNSAHGTITTNKLSALPGEEIALTITPEEGYKLKQIAVLDKFGQNPVTVSNNKFTMPNYNVIISSEFEEDVNYVFTEGANGTMFNTSNDELKFRINAEYSLLNKVYVDNKELLENEFTSKSGSTIINLKNDFLKTLTVGKHPLKVSFTDGKEVSTNFEIKEENKIDEKKVENNIEVKEENKTDEKKAETNIEVKEENMIEKDETPKTGTDNYLGIKIVGIIISIIGISTLKKRKV